MAGQHHPPFITCKDDVDNSYISASGRPLLMGVLNLTPDSFSDGGSYRTIDDAVRRAEQMVSEGADIIDIGGESTRPGSLPISADEEQQRVMPVIERLAGLLTIPLSIDTTKACIAREALAAGVSIINDISGMQFDPEMPSVIVDTNASIVIMHMQGNPRTMQHKPSYTDVVSEVHSFLDERIQFAENQGIQRRQIIIDPGIGFGKDVKHNLMLIKHIDEFCDLGCPVLLGVSRKGFIGAVTGAPVDNRTYGTAAVVAYAAIHGVRIHRVHDVAAMRQVCDIITAIKVPT
jgi:dihydropteroate synthase